MFTDIKQYDVKILTGKYVNLAYMKASPIRRTMAVCIDWVFISLIVFLLLTSCIYIDDHFANDIRFFDYSGYFIIPFVLFFNLFCEYYFNGKTIGKKLLKMQVLTDECTPPSLSQCLVRWTIFSLDIFLIGLIAINKTGKRIGDIASGCVVVRTNNKKIGIITGKDDFAFADIDFKPVHKNAAQLSQSDKKLVFNALHNPLYLAYRNEIAQHINSALGYINSVDNGLDFLKQVEQDYKYFDNAEPEPSHPTRA